MAANRFCVSGGVAWKGKRSSIALCSFMLSKGIAERVDSVWMIALFSVYVAMVIISA